MHYRRRRKNFNVQVVVLVGSVVLIFLAIIIALNYHSKPTNSVVADKLKENEPSTKSKSNSKGSGVPITKTRGSNSKPLNDEGGVKPPTIPIAQKEDVERRDKEQFIEIVKRNAENPAGLEIVIWGQKSERIASDSTCVRSVRFRCSRVGASNSSTRLDERGRPIPQPGDSNQPKGVPVMLEDAVVTYDWASGRIINVYLQRTFQIWRP